MDLVCSTNGGCQLTPGVIGVSNADNAGIDKHQLKPDPFAGLPSERQTRKWIWFVPLTEASSMPGVIGVSNADNAGIDKIIWFRSICGSAFRKADPQMDLGLFH